MREVLLDREYQEVVQNKYREQLLCMRHRHSIWATSLSLLPPSRTGLHEKLDKLHGYVRVVSPAFAHNHHPPGPSHPIRPTFLYTVFYIYTNVCRF
jgi:hypothetical protein